ncbi:actin-related protein 6 [Culicoides brevitarsis]|uniref:actin-related protein 6 n=1 Tax=Culicoides brevitarsis TaxID=469753 RepID=UPI00307C6DB8
MKMTTKPALVLDNGAFFAKIGLCTAASPKVFPNCIMKAKSERRRAFIGGQVSECRDASGLYYILSFQRGFLINFDIQKTLWDYMFSNDCCPVPLPETPVIITEPVYNFHSIQEAVTEIFFEEYEVEHLMKATGPDLAAYNYTNDPANESPKCCLVIECGYSFTHIVPIVKGEKQKKAIIRIDVGGKILTNHLKEIISYRQLNVMDETYVINQVKEDSCFVSQDFNADMEIARKRYPENTIVREYVLPDFTTLQRGILREPTKKQDEDYQTLKVNNERFAIPEILFHPSDIGINQMGIAEAAMHSVNLCPEEVRPHLLANIVLCGGSCLFEGLKSRLFREIRALAPDEYDVQITLSKDPTTYAWHGGKMLAKSDDFLEKCISRKEYEEHGSKICLEKFDI